MAKRLDTLILAAACTLFVGCDSPDDGAPLDGADDSFLAGGKADGGIEEGSADALAVLALVNEASFELLDDSDGVGLDVRAAAGIYEHRVGADGVEGSNDDSPFASLAELDAVPYVGRVAFSRLLDYALANGYQGEVEPEGPSAEALELGLMTLANNADQDLLDFDVGLDARAARNIWAHRLGDDGELGTDDDGYFRSRDELDAISYVGNAALGAMEAYAIDNGYVDPDPFSELFCARAPMSRDEAIDRLAPGQNFSATMPLTSYGVQTWSRTCGPTGCGDWEPSSDRVEGRIRATSLGAVWHPRVDMTTDEIADGMTLRLSSSNVRMSSRGTQRHRIYYPSTGRFAWEQFVTLVASVSYDSPSGSATFDGGSIDGESAFRVSDGCFQMRLFDERGLGGNREVLTVAYGEF